MSQQILWFRSEKSQRTAKWRTSDLSEDFPEIDASLYNTDAISSDKNGILQIETRSLKWDYVKGVLLELRHGYTDILNKYEHRLHPSSSD